MAGFAGLTAAIGAAAEKLDLAAPMAKLLQVISADKSMVATHQWIQPEVQVVGGGAMAANKEFHAEYCQAIWTLAWRQKKGTCWVEKYKFAVDAESDASSTRVSIIPSSPSENTFLESTPQWVRAQIIGLFRRSHFPVIYGRKRKRNDWYDA